MFNKKKFYSEETRGAIEKLLPLLDTREDCMLIAALNIKTSENNSRELPNLIINNRARANTNRGMRTITGNIREKILEQNSKYQKITKIIEKNDCSRCPLSVFRERYGIFSYNHGSKTCLSCIDRTEKLECKIVELRDNIQKSITEIEETEKYTDIFNCKAAINLITKKLENYDASKHKIHVCNAMHLHGEIRPKRDRRSAGGSYE